VVSIQRTDIDWNQSLQERSTAVAGLSLVLAPLSDKPPLTFAEASSKPMYRIAEQPMKVKQT
jgi:hypothetical protein